MIFRWFLGLLLIVFGLLIAGGPLALYVWAAYQLATTGSWPDHRGMVVRVGGRFILSGGHIWTGTAFMLLVGIGLLVLGVRCLRGGGAEA